MSEVLTSMEVSKKYSPDITKRQHQVNEIYIEQIRDLLKNGGTWIYPNAMQILTKVEGGWEVML